MWSKYNNVSERVNIVTKFKALIPTVNNLSENKFFFSMCSNYYFYFFSDNECERMCTWSTHEMNVK
eukprot:Pgem_evm1s5478